MDNPEYEQHEVEQEETNDEIMIEIAGEPKYYTTGQVAKILAENESTIRFWCDEFEQFLKIARSGRNRQFTALDIKKLEYIQYLLRQENFTIKQVKEFLSTKEAELMKPVSKERDQVIINALSQVIFSEIENRFQSLEDHVVARIKEELKNQLPALSTLYPSIQENLSAIQKDLKQQNMQLQDKIDELEKRIAERDAQFVAFVENFRNREKPKTLYEKLKHFFKKE